MKTKKGFFFMALLPFILILVLGIVFILLLMWFSNTGLSSFMDFFTAFSDLITKYATWIILAIFVYFLREPLIKVFSTKLGMYILFVIIVFVLLNLSGINILERLNIK